MAAINLGQLVATIEKSQDGGFADNITKKNALLNRLKQKGKIVMHDGGRSIAKGLEYAENSNFMYYSGYQVLDTTPTDTFDVAEYAWKHAATMISVSGPELRKTQGKNALINLLQGKIDNGMRTMSNNLSTGLYSDGTGSSGLQVGGLQSIVADAGTGTVGGINSTTNTFWRNIVYDASTDGGTAATASNILLYMNRLYNQLTRGDDAPDICVADLLYFALFESAQQTIQRFADSKMAEAGFQSYKYKGSDFILDNGTGILASHVYMLNTDYLSWDVHVDANVKALTERAPVNQDAQVVPLIWMGNLTCSNRSLQGVLKA